MQNAIVGNSSSLALMTCDCVSKGERKGGSGKRMPIFVFPVDEGPRDRNGVACVLQSNINGFHCPIRLVTDVLDYSDSSVCRSYRKMLVSRDYHLCGQGDSGKLVETFADQSFMCEKSPALLTTGMFTISLGEKFLDSMRLL
jgi:hypothetical protein